MTVPQYPGNSKLPPKEEAPEKVVEKVVTSAVVPKKQGLGRRLREMLIGGDSRSVFEYVITEVLVPQAKDMIAEAATQAFERMIYGEGRRGVGRSSSAPRPTTNYSKYSQPGNRPSGHYRTPGERTPNAAPRQSRMEDILFATRAEAELVVERMYDLLDTYESVCVADLYNLVGWSSTHTDQKWGWAHGQLSGIEVRRGRDGYVLELPKTHPLDY